MQLSTRSFSLKSLVTGIVAVGLVSIAIVIYSQWLVTRDFQRNTLFLRLMQTVQQEVATAHLWFEEALGGDRYISIEDDVRAQVQAAQLLVGAAIQGGATPLGEIPPLPEARDNLQFLSQHIGEFDRILSERWEASDTTGIIGGEIVLLGLLALPQMLRLGYDKKLAIGTICAGGSLGTIIPPSVVVVILAPVADVSVGDLFVGMLIPGLLLAALYIVYIIGRCIIWPEDGPRLPPDPSDPGLLEKLYITATAMVLPLFLIFAVLGTIVLGWATPTEAAAMGAIGTVILTIVYGQFDFKTLHASFLKTLQVTAMILTILLGGTMFAGVFVALGGISAVEGMTSAANLTANQTIFILLALAFLAGFVLDLISIVLIIIPVAIAIMRKMGVDDVWFCIMFLVVIQTSYLTPPMAPAIFYLRGISPPEITLGDMYRGVIPFIAIELLVLALVYFFPALALWLPELVFG